MFEFNRHSGMDARIQTHGRERNLLSIALDFGIPAEMTKEILVPPSFWHGCQNPDTRT